MNTCDTCKRWDKKSVGERDGVSHDGYAPKRYCSWLSHDNPSAESGVEAAAQGIGGASITTGPKFGCVHHEAQP